MPKPPNLHEPVHFAQCWAWLRVLVECVTGWTDVPEVKVALENNLEDNSIHPKTQSVSLSLKEIHMDQPLLLPQYKWPLPCVEEGSQMSPKILRLECDQEPGPAIPNPIGNPRESPAPTHHSTTTSAAPVTQRVVTSSSTAGITATRTLWW